MFKQNLVWQIIKWGFIVGTITVAIIGLINLSSCHTTKVTCYRKTPETFHLTKELFEWRINQPCGFIKNDTVFVDGKRYIIEFAPYK